MKKLLLSVITIIMINGCTNEESKIEKDIKNEIDINFIEMSKITFKDAVV